MSDSSVCRSRSLFAFGAWAFAMYRSPDGSVGYLGTGIASVLVAWALAIYLVVFIRKVRRIGLPT